MTPATAPAPSEPRPAAAGGGGRDHVDVLIVGAGLSGIGAARHLQDGHPERSFAILEGRERSGGTWDLFRYPGIRSDSDLSTFAFAFKPWTGEKAIADGPDILAYLRDAAHETGVDEHIRYDHRVTRAAWSTDEARWTVTAEHGGAEVELTCSWLFCASGYYRYDQGYSPEFPGAEDFAGEIIHPQHWPESFDAEGKRIVVVGSGATSVTLVPALAEQGAHVTMLQRSPSYVVPLPSRDPLGDLFVRVLGERLGRKLARRKNMEQQLLIFNFCQRYPNRARRLIRRINKDRLPEHVDVDVHFNPAYQPWDQRLCAVPDGDLFRTFRDGTAEIRTAHIDRFVPEGIRLQAGDGDAGPDGAGTGETLEADVIVTATGLNLLIFGGIEFSVDGEPVEIPQSLAYKGFMGSGMPNFSFAIGYTNSSWTLKIDLICEQLNRVLTHLDEGGHDWVVPVQEVPEDERRPLLDFKAGYVQRSVDQLPKQGPEAPWHLAMSFKEDEKHLRKAPVEDGVLRFGSRGEPLSEGERERVAVAA